MQTGMMKKYILPTLLFSLIALVARGQFIEEVLEYVPAPGQLINTALWGTPTSAESIVGGVDGHLCLGSFGGYVVFKFGQPVVNHPDNPFGIDFTIFGNASADWSEAAAVWVMKDENRNGEPDDTWYELAGSDYFFSTSIKNYEVTWFNPGKPFAADVHWLDNFGNEGKILANSFYTQPYYPLGDSFPMINTAAYQLKGTFIETTVDTTNPGLIKSYGRAFGYADNRQRGATPYTLPDNPYTPETENAGGDAFDLHWAVDSLGNYVDLDTIHFVKVQNSVLASGAWLGEISTEIAGAVLVAPQPGITGQTKMIVIKGLPPVIKSSGFQMEALAFYKGRLQPAANLIWQTNQTWATVDENQILHCGESGQLEIVVFWDEFPQISQMIFVDIQLSPESANWNSAIEKPFVVLPSPATDEIVVSGAKGLDISIFNVSGFRVKTITNYDGLAIPVSSLPKGLYLIHIKSETVFSFIKLVKK
jgi:hypothetical protein